MFFSQKEENFISKAIDKTMISHVITIDWEEFSFIVHILTTKWRDYLKYGFAGKSILSFFL